MAIELTVANEQTEQDVDETAWSRFARAVLAELSLAADVECSLRFVDEETIARLNEDYLDHTGPTDVLSFPIEDPASFAPGQLRREETPLLLGDIVICPSYAAMRAPEHDNSLEDELALLVVHGILHLIGMDHELDADAEVMEEKERALLRSCRGSVASQ